MFIMFFYGYITFLYLTFNSQTKTIIFCSRKVIQVLQLYDAYFF